MGAVLQVVCWWMLCAALGAVGEQGLLRYAVVFGVRCGDAVRLGINYRTMCEGPRAR